MSFKIILIIVVIASGVSLLALGGGDSKSEVRLDVSDLRSFGESMAKMNESLNEEEREKLAKAMHDANMLTIGDPKSVHAGDPIGSLMQFDKMNYNESTYKKMEEHARTSNKISGNLKI